MKVYLIALLTLLSVKSLIAEEADSLMKFQIVRDARSELLVYDPEFSSYVPYNSEIHAGTKYITLPIDINLQKQYPLVAYLKAGTSLFLDNNFFSKMDKDRWFSLGNIKWHKIHWLTIYNPKGALPFDGIFYGFAKGNKEPIKIISNKLEVRPPHAATFQNFFILIFVFILVLLAITKIFNNKVYNEFYNLKRNALAISKDQSYIFKKPLNSNNLLSLFIHCLIFVFIFFVIQYFTDGLVSLSLFSLNDSLIQILSNYLLCSLVVFAIYILKFILISFISYLYNLKEYRLAHYFNFLKLSMIFYLILLPLISVLYLWYDKINKEVLGNIVFITILAFSLGKILIITYNLNKIRQFRNLYLFSYLCATEIIPLFIVFKLLL